MSGNDPKNGPSDKSDITRIEDLSEYEHEEDEGFDEEESFSEFGDAQTDPNIQFPEEFRPGQVEEDDDEGPPDFSSLESEDEASEENPKNVPPEKAIEDSEDFSESDFENGDGENDFESETNFSDNFDSEDFDSGDFDSGDFDSGDFESDEADSSGFESSDFDSERAQNEEGEEEAFSEKELETQPFAKDPAETASETASESPAGDADAMKREEPKAPPAENFQELRKFAQNISYSNLASEGNPPYSIILRDIKYEEDIRDILINLKEFGVVNNQEDEANARKSLERGALLIPRLGEYAAVTVCHKLRRFDINILMGLTEEIHPPKTYDSQDGGIVSKHTVYNSKSHHYNLERDETSPQDVIASVTPYLENHEIIDYLGIASENAVVGSTLLENPRLEEELISRLPEYQQEQQRTTQIEQTNQEAAASPLAKDLFLADDGAGEPNKTPRKTSLKDIQNDLLKKLKAQAAQEKGNALVGVNFHVTPIGPGAESSQGRYQVICSGSIVWASKR